MTIPPLLNACDSCGQEIGEYDGAFCGPCADDYEDRRLDLEDAS